MHRLLKISFDQALMSLTPIATWFCLSFILDKNLINVFTLIYPLQYIYYIINAPLGTGANISQIRDKNHHAVMSGLCLTILISIIIFGSILLNIDQYITFMQMDTTIYHTFAIYAVALLLYQTIFSVVLDKLYYADRNREASIYSLVFNLLCFASVNGLALFTKNQNFIVSISLLLIGVFLFFILTRVWERFHFKLNLFNCIKYNSVEFASCCIMFLIFLFGISNALNFGPQYALALTFVALITDTQWDVLDSINIAAQIDITKKKFNYKKSLHNAYKLTFLLVASSILMFIGLYQFYELDFRITLIYFSFEFITFFIDPIIYIRTCFLQLNWSASKTTAQKVLARIFRLGLSLLSTPYCTGIGGLGSSLFQCLTINTMFRKHYLIDKNGFVRTRRHKNKKSNASLPQLQYHDLPIDDD